MRRAIGLCAVLLLAAPAAAPVGAAWGKKAPGFTQEEMDVFEAAAKLYEDANRDKVAAIEMFERFLQRFPVSTQASDAQFMIGDAYLDQALKILYKEAEAKKKETSRLMAPKNSAAVAALAQAKTAFEKVITKYNKKDTGLRASAQYRLGEIAYNAKELGLAIEEWRVLAEEFRKSYIVPEAWMGVIFANLALEQFSQAEANLFLLGETYPHYLKVPEVRYVQGIISLYKKDFANAERFLGMVKTPESQFYLGKTYLLSKKPYLAAAAFENLVRDYPDSVLREETEFFIGDSFFLAKDFDGAITKYQRFLSKYPQSQLRVSALFRIGSSYFQKGDYVEARAHFQSVIDRYPDDFFAPLAQYCIAESYLVAEQFREALFAYTKTITQYPETIKISPLAHYKLAWSQHQVSDYVQSAQTCRNFLTLYPNNALAKNVYMILANALLASNRPDEAVTSFQRIVDLAPTSDVAEQALFSILQTQHRLKRFNAILTSYQFIFRHLPPSQSKWRPMSYLYAAEAYLGMNRTEEAKALYDMVLKVYPDSEAAFYAQDGLAWTCQIIGDDDCALRERRKLNEMLTLARSSFSFAGVNQLGIADSMYNRKEYEEAYELYDKFARQNPQTKQAPQALYQGGMSLYHLRYYTQAIETWTRLRDGYPESPEAVKAEYQIGDTLFRAQKYDESVAQYKRIIDKFPKSEQLPLAYLRVAMSYYNAKDDPATLNGALALLSRFPDAPEATDALDLMEAVYDRNAATDFRRSLRAVIEAAPHTAVAGEAQYRIGRRLFEVKRYDDAAEEFQRFSVDYTGNAKLKKAQFLLGESYFNGKKFQEAGLSFSRFLDNFPMSDDTPLALFHLGSAHYSLKEYEKAQKIYQRLVDEFPQSEYNKAAQFNLALVYKATGELDRAAEAYTRYAASAGADDEGGRAALWELFTIQKDRKEFPSAMGTLTRLLDAKPDPDTLLEASFRRGELLMLMNQPNDAVRAWEDLALLQPKENSFRLQGLIKLGEIYEKGEEMAKAVGVYDELSRYAPTAQVRDAARDRAKGLRAFLKQKGKSVDEEAVSPGGDRFRTQVMPQEEGGEKPAGEKPVKKPGKGKPSETKPSEAKPADGAQPAPKPPANGKAKKKQINIPGMD